MATEAVFVEVMNSTVLYMDGTGNEFYQKYKDVGVIWIAMPALTLIILFVLIGFWGNGNIVIATWRNKALHGPCNYLLAISAAVDSLHGLSQFVQASIFYTGINFIPLKLCVFLQTLPLTGLNFGIILILLIGIDRVLSVMLPGRHRSMNVGVYMAIMMGICMAYNLILLYFTYDFALKHANS
uniref:G-protein coupled receptors family 1 profile domain-containing protein n=1 Tax=Panagrolaimus sp. JU765 TaxID=591449 RepID=A0AC34RIH0_9BILA